MNRQSISIIFVVIAILLLISGCATLPTDFERPKSYAFTDTEDTRFGKAHRDEMRTHAGQSGFLRKP